MRTLLLMSLLAFGCGDDSAPADTGTADTGTADTGTADTGAADTGTADTGTADTGTDAGDDVGADTAVDAVADTGSTDLVITVESAAAWANCMPIVPADPLRFNLELRYDNSAGASIAMTAITSATLTFDDPAAMTAEIDFDVETVDIGAGINTTQTHNKTTSTPIIASCAICATNPTMTYDLEIDVDGTIVPVTGTTSFGCTF